MSFAFTFTACTETLIPANVLQMADDIYAIIAGGEGRHFPLMRPGLPHSTKRHSTLCT